MIDNITLYKTFVAVADSESISAAARALYISQPAVSSEIAQLEDKLGTKLFFRTNRGVSLTPEGTLLYGYIKRGFSFLEAGEDKLREIAGLSDGVLRVGASDMTLRFFLLDHIEKFNREYPGVMLTITNAPTPKTLEALRSGVLDFGVISDDGELSFSGEEFVTLEVKKIRDIFAVPPTHPLAKKETVSYSELAEYPVIMLEKNSSTRRYLDGIFGDVLHPAIELATSDLILEFARRNMGVASIVEDFAKEDLKTGTLVKLNVEPAFPERRFLLVYLSRTPLSAAARRLITSVEESLGI